MKPPVSNAVRQQVLDLRRTQSLRQVADSTGLPLGTVKTICSRSGAFRDNQRHRALFSLPPMRESESALPMELEIPRQRVVTGDNEVDAVLWLRECISTGQASLIDLALENARKIRTPLSEIEKRYSSWLGATNPGNLFATCTSIGFADLSEFAEESKARALLRHEALSRFGDGLFEKTEAERFCVDALAGTEPDGFGLFNQDDASKRFGNHPGLLPQTLTDCLHELFFWDQLRRLRNSVDRDQAEIANSNEGYARECFVFSYLGKIRPRSKDEALSVLRWMLADKQSRFSDDQVDSVLPNLIG